jgi:hypothetical protein
MQVTNTANQVMHFDPFHVVLLTGPLPTDTQPVFYVHGLGPPPIPQLPGTMDVFVPTMPNGNKYAKLTFAHGGASFYVHSPSVRAINPVPSQLQAKHPDANAIIGLAGHNRFVRETVATAKTLITNTGGTI